MSLFTDDDFATTSDLAALDGEVPDVAEAESIIIEGDAGIARQTWDECADRLIENLQSFDGSIIGWPGAIANYAAFGTNRPRFLLNRVIVSDIYGRRDSPLRRWMVYHALVMFYRSASSRRESDRYARKYEAFKIEEKSHWRTLWAAGLPCVSIPLSAPGAVHELNAGDFTNSAFSFVVGGSSSGASYSVAITWVDAVNYVSPLNKQNAESGPSVALSVTIPASNVLGVSIAALNPPGSIPQYRGIANGPYYSRPATGWNVYVGLPGGTLYQQNATPIPIATSSYTLAGAPVLSGPILATGQAPDFNQAFQNMLFRG